MNVAFSEPDTYMHIKNDFAKNCHSGKLFVYNSRYMINYSIGACLSGEHGGIILELTKELKEKVEKAETKEEAKKIIEEAGFILDDAELDQVAGGIRKYR